MSGCTHLLQFSLNSFGLGCQSVISLWILDCLSTSFSEMHEILVADIHSFSVIESVYILQTILIKESDFLPRLQLILVITALQPHITLLCA